MLYLSTIVSELMAAESQSICINPRGEEEKEAFILCWGEEFPVAVTLLLCPGEE